MTTTVNTPTAIISKNTLSKCYHTDMPIILVAGSKIKTDEPPTQRYVTVVDVTGFTHHVFPQSVAEYMKGGIN